MHKSCPKWDFGQFGEKKHQIYRNYRQLKTKIDMRQEICQFIDKPRMKINVSYWVIK